jgi:hypothetical protein
MLRSERKPCRCPLCRRTDYDGLKRISTMLKQDHQLSGESRQKLKAIVWDAYSQVRRSAES